MQAKKHFLVISLLVIACFCVLEHITIYSFSEINDLKNKANELLAQAVKANNETDVEHALEVLRADPNLVSENGFPVLHQAIVNNNYGITLALLKQGANPLARVNIPALKENSLSMYQGMNAIHTAIAQRSWALLDVVLEYSGLEGVNAQFGRSHLAPLHQVFTTFDKEQVSSAFISLNLLARYEARVNSYDNSGNSPLHHAVAYAHDQSLVTRLLTLGALPNTQNSSGQTPLHMATMRSLRDENILAIVTLLLAHGANPLLYDEKELLPIEYLTEKDKPIVRALLLAGAQDPKSNQERYAYIRELVKESLHVLEQHVFFGHRTELEKFVTHPECPKLFPQTKAFEFAAAQGDTRTVELFAQYMSANRLRAAREFLNRRVHQSDTYRFIRQELAQRQKNNTNYLNAGLLLQNQQLINSGLPLNRPGSLFGPRREYSSFAAQTLSKFRPLMQMGLLSLLRNLK